MYKSFFCCYVFQTFPGPGAYNPRYPSKPVTKPVAPFWTATKRNDKRSQKAFLQNYVSRICYINIVLFIITFTFKYIYLTISTSVLFLVFSIVYDIEWLGWYNGLPTWKTQSP